MQNLVRMGIQGKGSTSVPDLTILAEMLFEQKGIKLELTPEDNTLLRTQWLKSGKLDAI